MIKLENNINKKTIMNKTKLIYCSSCLAAALPGLAANAASATPEANGNSSQ